MEAKVLALAEKLGQPGARKLQVAARREGINVTISEINTLLSTEPTRQIFHAPLRSDGKAYAPRPRDTFQMDLIDYHKKGGGPTRPNILVLVDVFTRELWAREVTTKETHAVMAALSEVLDDVGDIRGAIITMDRGKEWMGTVPMLLRQKGVVMQHKDITDKNAIGVVDRAIMNLKRRIGRFPDAPLKRLVDQYNATDHAAVYGPPEDVVKTPDVRFMLFQDNADKFLHNTEIFARNKKKLEEAGAFRRAIPVVGGQFKRSFKPAWGDIEVLDRIENGLAHPAKPTVVLTDKRLKEEQPPIKINLVLPVELATLTGAWQLKRDAQKTKAEPDVIKVLDLLGNGDGRRSLSALAKALGKGIADKLRLFPEHFDVSDGYVTLLGAEGTAAPASS